MTDDPILRMIESRIHDAQKRYGPFASTHESLGVAMEEWKELRDEIHANNIDGTIDECCDLAAVLIRLARDLKVGGSIVWRSTK
mgnify:FL=1